MIRLPLFTFAMIVARPIAAQFTCSTALPVQAGIHVVAAVEGAEIPAPICAPNGGEGVSASMWYSYTAATDTIVLVSTYVPGQPSVNTRLHVYTGNCGALQCVVGNDDGGIDNTSRASFSVVEGETYLIAFDDRWSAAGFSFDLSEIFYPVLLTETYIRFGGSFLSTQGSPLGVVDMDNDNLDDVVAVSNMYVNINRQLPEGGFETINVPTPPATFMPTWSMAAGDLTGNGYKDLLYGNGYGVSIMLANDDGLGFTQQAGPEYVFSQRTNMVDINNDGHLDAFVCHDVAPNVYYMNDGNGNFTFTQGGLGFSCGNYGSIWVDYDNDGDQDCFVAKCGCDPADLLMRNDGNGVFSQQGFAQGFADNHQSWSSAWGDFDNDGDMDALIGASSSGYHKLMRNNGDGTFTNATAGSGMDLFWGQGIEWTTHDFNNDGHLDILGAGVLLVNQGDMTFLPNTYSPQNGAVGDLNNDGYLDVIGQYGFQVNEGNGNNWLRINTIGTVSNRNGIGARITLTSALGTQIREIRSGDGFRYMSSLMAHFGLGTDEEVQQLTVRWPSGIVQEVQVSQINTVIDIVEPLTTALPGDVQEEVLHMFPNPVNNILRVSTEHLMANATVQVLDLAGRVVLERLAGDGTLQVGMLASGQYVLRLVTADRVLKARFNKL